MQATALRKTKQSKNTMGTPWCIEKLLLDGILVAQTHKSCNLLLKLDIGPLKYPCAYTDPNLLLQKCKPQHFNKLKEVKTPWVLVSTLKSGHSISAY